MKTMHDNKYNDIDYETFINSIKSEDIIPRLGEKIRKYNVYDILCRLAALNCVPENQNKEVLICGLIEELLSHPEMDYSTLPKMSHNRFNQIIGELEKSNLVSFIDPAEGPVVQSIIWKGNTFLCFPGMDKDSVFRLQMLLDALETLTFDNTDFWKDVWGIIRLTLSVQNMIARKQHLSEGFYAKQPREEISVKTSSELTEIIRSISITNYSKNRSSRFSDTLCCSFGQVKSDNYDHYTFYNAPFFYNKSDNSLIPLHIGILTEFTYLRIIELSKHYKIDGPLMECYNKIVIDDCCKSLKILGHLPIYEELVEEDCYSKELVFSAFGSNLLIVEFIKENIKVESVDQIDEIGEGKRCIKLSDRIINLGFDSSRLNYLILFNTSVASTSCTIFNSAGLYGNGIVLKPFELQCISINEYNNEDFIPRFSNAYSKIKCPLRPFTHTLDAIQLYISNNFSFYRDDIDIRNTSITFTYGLSIEYISKALVNNIKTIIPYYEMNTIVVAHTIDDHRNIFALPGIRKHIERCIKINSLYIWLITEEISNPIKENVLHTVVDILSYWIGENSSQLAPYCQSKGGVVPIMIELPDCDEAYWIWEKTNNNPTSFQITGNYISINFTADNYRQLSRFDNIKEKELFIRTIECIFTLIGVQLPSIDYTAFSNPAKMLVDFSNTSDDRYLEPVSSCFSPRCIHEDDIGSLLNDIGDYICNSTQKVHFHGDECVDIVNKIISYLFDTLFSILREYDSTSTLLMAYEDMENAIYECRTKERRLHKDILCYPEKKEEYLAQSSKANRLSLTLKCLIEIQASIRNPKEANNPIIRRKEYEYLLAICTLIISWGRTRDAIAHNLIKQEIKILSSGRVGINYSEFDYFSSISNEFRTLEAMVGIKEPDFLTKHFDELDLAYMEDYGYSLSEKFSVLQIFFTLKKENDLVQVCSTDELLTQIRKRVPKIPISTITRILDDSTLSERAVFYTPPEGYERRDVFPWKFTRSYCFIRKPLVKVGNALYWGSRNLSFLMHEELGLIYNEKLKTKSNSKIKKVLGSISKERSSFFNDYLFSIIREFNGYMVRKNVKKDSMGKRIVDENGLDIGDIDILAFVKKTKTIFVIEVKNYSFSRNNPDEIYSELSKIEKYHKKHLRRVQWVANHKDDICKIFNVGIVPNLKVKETMITRAPILARHLLDESVNIIASYELSEKKLSLLKATSFS